MTQQTSTLLLTNVTTIDFGYIDGAGRLRGHSVNPVIEVTGKLNGEEAVVADFSSIKKQIKALIDDPEAGYDHKLLVPAKFMRAGNKMRENGTLTNEIIYAVATPSVDIIGPANAFRTPTYVDLNSDLGTYPALLAEELATYLGTHLVGFDFRVVIDIAPHKLPHGMPTLYGSASGIKQFSYTHGLPNSTSWGCVNIAHGHRSFIQALAAPSVSWSQALDAAMQTLADKLDNTYFLNAEYLRPADDNTTMVKIGYTHKERGHFELTAFTDALKTVITPYETTVENLAEYVRNLPEAQALAQYGVTGLYVSEGQWKGCTVPLTL